MLSNEFIKSEMLAESYISRISMMKRLLRQGKIKECLQLIYELEEAMNITLAIGELYDSGQARTIN